MISHISWILKCVSLYSVHYLWSFFILINPMQQPLFANLEVEIIYVKNLYQLIQWKQWIKIFQKNWFSDDFFWRRTESQMLRLVRNQTNTTGNSSARGVPRQLDVNTATVWIIKKNFSSLPISLRLSFSINPSFDICSQDEVDEAWPWIFLWSDKAHFYLNGTVKC